MTTQVSTKLAALALALSVNVIMMGGVAFLFHADPQASQIQALAATAAHGALDATPLGANAASWAAARPAA